MAPPTRSTSTDVADKMEEMNKTLASFSRRFDKLENLLATTIQENKDLKQIISDRDKEVTRLSSKLNDLEQYGRSWSVRVLNLSVPSEEANDPLRVMQHVYDAVLAPILHGAVEKGALIRVPPVDQILETAHILPPKPDSVPPIICRFYSRNIRALSSDSRKTFPPVSLLTAKLSRAAAVGGRQPAASNFRCLRILLGSIFTKCGLSPAMTRYNPAGRSAVVCVSSL